MVWDPSSVRSSALLPVDRGVVLCSPRDNRGATVVSRTLLLLLHEKREDQVTGAGGVTHYNAVVVFQTLHIYICHSDDSECGVVKVTLEYCTLYRRFMHAAENKAVYCVVLASIGPRFACVLHVRYLSCVLMF